MHSSVAFHFTPYRIPFQLQIKFQGIESLSHSSGLAACPSSSLLSLSPVTLLKGVDAFPQHQTFAQGRRCLTLSADGYMGSTLFPPVRRILHGVDAFSPKSAEVCTGSTLSPPVCRRIHWSYTFSLSLPNFARGRRFLPQSADLHGGNKV